MTDRPDPAALRALAEAATPGPWRGEPWNAGGGRRRYREGWVLSQADSPWTLIARSYVSSPADDAAYIAACSPDRILALIAEVEDRRGTVERIRKALPVPWWTVGREGAYYDMDKVYAILDAENARHAR